MTDGCGGEEVREVREGREVDRIECFTEHQVNSDKRKRAGILPALYKSEESY